MSAKIGRTSSATFAMRRTPPKTTGAVSTASSSALQCWSIVCALRSTSLMVLAWTMLNATPKVKISSTANRIPPRRDPRPVWM